MASDGRGWTSKDILTWAILIWGFSRLSSGNTVLGSAQPGCTFPMTAQSGLATPGWIVQTAKGGPGFTVEGES
jgi:hypothetical protein